MRTDRRGFLRLVGSALALLGAGPRARARISARELHLATRNTALGALGVRLKALGPAALRYKPYPGLQRVALPPPVREPDLPLAQAVGRDTATSGFRGESASLGQLGRLLYFTNGVTGKVGSGGETVQLRAAPSAGALYAGEVYAVVERVRGLPAGIYYYSVRESELVQLRRGSFADAVARALERPGEIEGAAAVVLLTNVFGRYRWRYANRGYRYALIDSGHIGENLRLAAASAGWAETGWLRFHDAALNALLGVDGREEAVCAVHAVGRPRLGSAAAMPPTRRLVEQQDAVEHPRLRGPATERYHEATQLVPAPPSAARAPPGPAPVPPQRVSELVLEKRDVAPAASVETSIAGRRSAASFDREPMALADLGFVLEVAGTRPAARRPVEVDIYLVAHRVTGLAPGFYRYHPWDRGLAPLRRGDLSRAMVDACLGQRKAGRASAGVLMVGRIADAAARAGARGYRDLLLEAGAIGQRVYLAAEAVGLVARNLAAFLDERLNELAGLDGRREAVIHLTVLGPGA